MKPNRIAGILCALALGGCLSIDKSGLDGKYVCGAGGSCPNGLICSPVDNHCHATVVNVTMPKDMSMTMPPVADDLAGGGSVDMSTGGVVPSADKSLVMPRTASALANGQSAIIIDITVRDGDGNLLSGLSPSVDVSGAGVTVTPPLRTFDGKTSAQVVSQKAEDKTVTVTVAGVTLKTATITFTPVTVASLQFQSIPKGAGPGTVINPGVQVKAFDADQFPYSGDLANVSLTLMGGDPTAKLSGGTGTPLNASVATFNNLVIDKTGTDFQLVAHSGGVDSQPSGKFNVTAARPGAPTGITTVWDGPHVKISWTAPATGSTPAKYQVFRGTSATAINTQVGGDTTATALDDPAFLLVGSYYYDVIAIDGNGIAGDPSDSRKFDVARELCVVDTTAGTMSIVSTDSARAANPVLRQITGLTSAAEVAADLKNDEIFVADQGGTPNAVRVFDRSSATLIEKTTRRLTSGVAGPTGVALYQTAPGAAKAYDEVIVANNAGGTVEVFDRTGTTPKWTISGLMQPQAVTTDPSTSSIYISSSANPVQVWIYDHELQALRTTIASMSPNQFGFPYGMDIDVPHKTLFIATAAIGAVLEFATDTRAYSSRITFTGKASGVVYDANSLSVWISNLQTGVVTNFSTGGTAGNSISGFSKPFGLALCN